LLLQDPLLSPCDQSHTGWLAVSFSFSSLGIKISKDGASGPSNEAWA
jgi:hypothetical protein